MHIEDRIESFVRLGHWLRANLKEIEDGKTNELASTIEQTGNENAWFTKDSVIKSLYSILEWLDDEALKKWTGSYYISEQHNPKKVAVIMAGNIPLVNFHDFLSVLITGNKFLGKLSSQDKRLLPFIANKLIQLNSHWKDMIDFTEDRLDIFDVVIATGSNNTSRYFEYYFGKYPHIIRKNRNSIAILIGNETEEELIALYDDIFQYYGMGCRNVSMLLVPMGYSFPTLFNIWEGLPASRRPDPGAGWGKSMSTYKKQIIARITPGPVLQARQVPTTHNKYHNNYEYYRSLYLVNRQPFFDTGYASILKNDSIASPISVIHYKEYNDIEDVSNFLKTNLSQIQCIVSTAAISGLNIIQPGLAQSPNITDYPDRIDIIQFLLAL